MILRIPKTNIDFVSKKAIAFLISICLTILTMFLLLQGKLVLGIDFTGGVIIEIKINNNIDTAAIRKKISEHGYSKIAVQRINNSNEFTIRLQMDNGEKIELLKDAITELDHDVEFNRVDFVGAKVGKTLITQGILAIICSLFAMMVYISIRFDWKFGIGAIVALLHDVVTTLGFYAVSGFEFNLTSVAVLLTVIGYSINDSVVIFDRVRENMRKHKTNDFKKIINISVNDTLSRTIMTSFTTMIGCLALVLFGGQVLLGFSMAMLFGIFFGTYSSIYIAAPILIYSHK